MNIRDNPITKLVDYRRCVGETIPNLMILDGMSVGINRMECVEKIDSFEFSSSLSSSLSRDIDRPNGSNNNDIQQKTLSHEIDSFSFIQQNSETVLTICNRPSTAGTHMMSVNLLSIFMSFHSIYIFFHSYIAHQSHSAIRIVRYAMVKRLSAI